MKTHPCPKCNRQLLQSGELKTDGQTFTVFQCDECFTSGKVYGVAVELSLTFAVDSDGQIQQLASEFSGFSPDEPPNS